jgi:hypothetical protein
MKRQIFSMMFGVVLITLQDYIEIMESTVVELNILEGLKIVPRKQAAD